ncbi:MAG TPA: SDR family NAD(P)-dependent oxidoreductase, partial [Candidatus Paenibacillus intestinavium]|nr:SDR family NAD(P)-dependent oxidoreductase [Candidatus Paenibacillus intestinavium]
MKLTGHTILITGGASGIGLALTEQFIQHNNELIVVGRDEYKLYELQLQYPSITTYVCNVGIEADLQLLIDQLQHNHPKLNIII